MSSDGTSDASKATISSIGGDNGDEITVVAPTTANGGNSITASNQSVTK